MTKPRYNSGKYDMSHLSLGDRPLTEDETRSLCSVLHPKVSYGQNLQALRRRLHWMGITPLTSPCNPGENPRATAVREAT